MKDMKCPVCQTILDKSFLSDKVRGCPKCRNIGNIDLWQKLDHTKKALDLALDALKRIKNHATAIDTARCRAEMALDQINKTLEQKDE